MVTNAEAAAQYKVDKLMCDNGLCSLRLACQRFEDYTKSSVSEKVERSQTFYPHTEDDEPCNTWVLRIDLDTENLRDNPKLHRQFTPGTKRHRRRGGEWV